MRDLEEEIEEEPEDFEDKMKKFELEALSFGKTPEELARMQKKYERESELRERKRRLKRLASVEAAWEQSYFEAMLKWGEEHNSSKK